MPVVVSSVPLPDDAWFDGPLDECFVQQRRTKVMKTLQSSGAAVVRGCCSVNHLRSCHRLLGKHQQLRETAGNGVSASSSESRGSIAGSFYCDLEGYDDVQRLCEELLSPEGFSRRLQPQPKKTIFLSYGLGGENWAHQDNNCCQACPFQALLLLSHPGVDFSGGTFYVARKARGGGIIRHEVALTSPGDLVVFQAGKGSGWFHGILPVRRGTAEDCRREAVGLLQPA